MSVSVEAQTSVTTELVREISDYFTRHSSRRACSSDVRTVQRWIMCHPVFGPRVRDIFARNGVSVYNEKEQFDRAMGLYCGASTAA